ncbi:MAG: PAS domain S-box protein [Methanomassiliicoccales archaeon]|nr:PAS domain S-box protein [Methanomassiliicoccales archaeon]
MTRILYVDDEPGMLEIVKTFLEGTGDCTVETVLSAEDALRIIQEKEFDVVVSDYVMPGMTGIDLLKTLRQKGDDTPFIVFTGRGREEVVIEALNSGADFYLKKGGDLRSQLAELRNLINFSREKGRAVRALRESEKKFRNLVELAKDGIVVVQDAKIKYLNAQMANMVGYTIEEVFATDPRKLIPPEELPKLIDFYSRFGSSEKIPSEFETVILHKSGKKVPVVVSAARIDYEERPAEFFIVRDITDRKKSEEMHARVFSLLEAVFESTNDGFLVVDRQGRTIKFNRRFLELWKIPDSYASMIADERLELIKDQLKDPEGFATKVKSLLYRNPAAETFDILEFKDGRVFERYSRPLMIGDEIAGRIWSFRDVTGRKKLEEEIHRSAELYRAIFENTGTATILVEEDMTIVLANEEFERLSGFSKEEIEGKIKWTQFASEKDRPRMMEYHRLRGIDPKAAPRKFEFKFVDRNGKAHDILSTVGMVPGTKLSVASYNDISELRKAQSLLREEKEEQELLLDSIDTMVWYAADPETYGKVNRAFADFLGLKKEDLWGKKLYEVRPPREAEECIRSNRAAFESGRPVETFEQLTNFNGRKRLLWVKKIPKLGPDGRTNYLVCSANDITDLKLVENALRLANRKLYILGSVIRHDILNQLTLLGGYAEMLKNHITDEKGAGILNKMRHASERIERILKSQSEYEKMGTKEPEWIYVEKILKKAAEDIGLEGISLEVDLEGLEILADPLVGRVFYNLLHNSIVHGKKVSLIRVYARMIDKGMAIVYEDDGIGIPKNLKSAIFELSGRGAHGLHFAREILSLTDMTIEETGEEGKGARFEIFVPEGNYRFLSK